jgi:hypothetical protein
MVFPNPFRAAGALYRLARAWFTGDPFIVSGRIHARRRRLCKRCFWRDPKSDQCMKCSCFLSLKTELTTEKCPLGKW